MCEHNLKIGDIIRGTFEGNCILCGHHQITEGIFEYTGNHSDSRYSGHILKVLTPNVSCACGEPIKKVLVNCRSIGPIDVTQEFLSLPVRSRE